MGGEPWGSAWGPFPSSPSFPMAPAREPGESPNLEVGLLEDARPARLRCCSAPPAACRSRRVSCTSSRLLSRTASSFVSTQPLMGLGVGVEQVDDASPRAPGYQAMPHPPHSQASSHPQIRTLDPTDSAARGIGLQSLTH